MAALKSSKKEVTVVTEQMCRLEGCHMAAACLHRGSCIIAPVGDYANMQT